MEPEDQIPAGPPREEEAPVTALEAAEDAPESEPTADELSALVEQIDAEIEANPDILAPRAKLELSPTERYLGFRLGPARFAVPSRFVLEVGSVPPRTLVPRVPSFVLGVTNLRGDILSVVDLATFLHLPETQNPGRMLVVRGAGDEVFAGLVVSEVTGMTLLSEASIRDTAAPVDDPVTPYLAGVVEHKGQVISILNLERLLASPEFRPFESV